MGEISKVSDPTFEQLKVISQKHNLQCTDIELAELQEIIPDSVAIYNFVNDYKCEGKTLMHESKREFYRPEAEENTHNAWYIKCNIKGNDSGKLLNKRVAIKDNTAVANIPMMNGSSVMEGYIPEYDATVVQRILEHGGIIAGKTTCEELCLSGSGHLSKYGPVMNPLNKEYISGGSSSGSAVVVALGEADMAIGGDQAGSIRIPSSCCGIVGLKPTHGLVPYTGAVPITPALDNLGPMAKSVADCALLLECIAGYDNGFDYRQSSFNTDNMIEYSKLIYPNIKPLKKIKIGVLKEGVDICDENVKKIFTEAVNHLKENSMLDVEEISYLDHKNSEKVFLPLLWSGLYGSLMAGCGAGASIKGIQSHTLAKQLFTGYKQHGHEMGINVKMLMILGDYILQNYGTYHYAKASTIVAHMNLEYNKMLEQFDVIIMPTLVRKPVRIPGPEVCIKETMIKTTRENTCIFDATGHPALSLNCGFDEGLPVGLQIVGKHFDEVGVLNAASIIEENLMQFLKK